MGRFIKAFADNTYIEYDQGKFDEHCVYYVRPNKNRSVPLDTQYFKTIKEIARKYGAEKTYADIVFVYNLVQKEIRKADLDAITNIAQTYGSDSTTVDIIYSILYAAMLSEENKAFTKLGKRIKRYGIHMLLFEDKSIEVAANVMRGKRWTDIDKACRERGF